MNSDTLANPGASVFPRGRAAASSPKVSSMAPWRRVITKMACNGTIHRNLWFTATVVAHQFRQGHVSGIKEDHPGGFHRRWSGSRLSERIIGVLSTASARRALASLTPACCCCTKVAPLHRRWSRPARICESVRRVPRGGYRAGRHSHRRALLGRLRDEVELNEFHRRHCEGSRDPRRGLPRRSLIVQQVLRDSVPLGNHRYLTALGSTFGHQRCLLPVAH